MRASIQGQHATNLQNHAPHEDRHAKWRTEAIATGSAPTHIPVVFNPVSVFSFLPYEDEKSMKVKPQLPQNACA
jgi:hypothetical protein